MLNYVKGDLFGAHSGVLAHACNCYGSWGGGIAAQFKRRYPEAYRKYHQHCVNTSPSDLIGTCYLIKDKQSTIACLFTSDNSSEDEIVTHTKSAVADLLKQVPASTEICMPKINAGIFNVPWEKTEHVLEGFSTARFSVYVL